MKHTLRRVTALVMCAVLCVIPMQFSPVTAATTEQPLMAFVPLDNRPVCVDRVIYEAESAGFDIELPPEDSYKTLLDGQGGSGGEVNGASGWQHGDGAAIMTWLEGMEADGCDYYVIHLDQILSGGLVGSRYPDNADGGINDTERALLERLDKIVDKQVDGEYENHVYFVDTVMRLASTVGYKGLTGAQYDAFREYAMVGRLDVDVSNYDMLKWGSATEPGAITCIDAINANYSKDMNGNTISYGSALTSGFVQMYHNARRRKLDMLYATVTKFQNTDSTVYIFGVDDASPQETIQTAEIDFVRALMTSYDHDFHISADTDSSGLMAVARCVNDYYKSHPNVKAIYFGDKADEKADQFDIATLRENMQSHVETLGCLYIDEQNNASATAEVEVLVLTQANTNIQTTRREDVGYTAAINNLIAHAKSNIANHVPTIVIDASTEGNYAYSWVIGATNLQDELIKNLDITRLMGYSNWNTVGNSLGIALGNGMARYTYLANADNITMSAHTAFLQTMTHAYIKDITYVARNKLMDYTWLFKYWFKSDASSHTYGWDDNNFYQSMLAYNASDYHKEWELCAGERYVNNALDWMTMEAGAPKEEISCGKNIIEKINNGTYYQDLRGDACKVGDVGTVTLDRFRFPWYRIFEMTFDIHVSHDYFTVDSAAGFLKDVKVNQHAATFIDYAKADLSADSVTVADWDNAAVADNAYVGTGYTVTTVSGDTTSSYQIVIKGDVSGDGKITTDDVRDVLRHMVGLETFDVAVEAREAAANVDNDASGDISSIDARRMLQMALNYMPETD